MTTAIDYSALAQKLHLVLSRKPDAPEYFCALLLRQCPPRLVGDLSGGPFGRASLGSGTCAVRKTRSAHCRTCFETSARVTAASGWRHVGAVIREAPHDAARSQNARPCRSLCKACSSDIALDHISANLPCP